MSEPEALHAIAAPCASHGHHPTQGAVRGFAARRQQESTKDFKTLYATRAGVEGTISQGVGTMGLRRSRYIGQERTHLQHVATAAAINVVRLMWWLDGVPHAKTRQSPLAQLHRPAA